MNSNVNRPIKTILADIADNAKVANRDLESLPPSVRPGHVGAIRRAKENVTVLLAEYRAAVLENSLAFFVEGGAPGAPEQFAEIAAEEGTLTADAGSMYASLAELIESVMSGSREFGIDQVVRLDYLLRGIATTSGYGRAVDLPRTAATYTVKDKKALAQHLRKLTETTGDGPKLNVLVTTQKLIDQAVARRFARRTFAVVIVNASAADKKVLETMFNKKVAVDLTGVETIDAGFVIGTFKQARNEAPPADPK